MNWKNLFSTRSDDWSALIVRLTLGLILFPHGAQKLLGWFGGYGFTGTMDAFTQGMHLPWIIAFLVILIESIGSLALIAGVATRFFSLAMLGNFIGIILTAHLHNGFFMNWYMQPGKPEGFEYHLLILGLAIAAIIAGGGKWSVDSLLMKCKKSETTY